LHFDVQNHAPNLEALIKKLGDVRLIGMDPSPPTWGKATVTRLPRFEPRSLIQRLADKYGATVAMISHPNKNTEAKTAQERVAGSGAFVAVSRWQFLIDFDPDDPEPDKRKRRRFMAPMGSNVGNDAEGFWFRIVDAKTQKANPTTTVEFTKGAVLMDADDLISKRKAPSPAVASAMEFLRGEMAGGEWHESEPLIAAAAKQGISGSSLQRATDYLTIEKRKDTLAGGWSWRLGKSGNDGPLGATANAEELFSTGE
jgi:putative DNA primase/helicase